MGAASDPGAPVRRARPGRTVLMLAGIWALGLIALGSIVFFENRVDATRRAQVVIATLRNGQATLTSIAFSPALLGVNNVPSREQTARQLAGAKSGYLAATAELATFGRQDATARVAAASSRYFAFVDSTASLVENGQGAKAALELGTSERPGGAYAGLTAALDRSDREFGADAAHSRAVGTAVTVAAVLFLLLAFSIAFQDTLRARRRSQRDATTDALTGLGNRRKLFADMERGFGTLDRRGPLAVGMFDLDGFKHYNDTFGHPAGDALLARLGSRLAAVSYGDYIYTSTNGGVTWITRDMTGGAWYGVEVPAVPFECTVRVARASWGLRPTTLRHVADHLGLSLQHHDAASDAEACARIVLAAAA